MRIILIRPCCIGDVVLATGVLVALRTHYPQAHITWAISDWSARVIESHPALDALLLTGKRDLPIRHPVDFVRFVSQLRAGQYELAVSLVRSRLMTWALRLANIPQTVGIDSAGRGASYTIPVPIDPAARQHEADIYRQVVAALGCDVQGIEPSLPVTQQARAMTQQWVQERGITGRYFVVHPAGGSNPGMVMHHKRWPPEHFAQLIQHVQSVYAAQPILIGGPQDGAVIDAVERHLDQPCVAALGELSFAQIGALAAAAFLYVGNDTGLTHLAAAAGGRTAMILGPTDPLRYGPVGARTLALWKPIELSAGGVAQATTANQWDWGRDGIGVTTAQAQIDAFLAQTST